MAAAVQINFKIGGVASVEQALRTVEQSTIRAERATKKMYDEDVKAAKKATSDKEKEFQKLAKWVEQQNAKDVKDLEKVHAAELKSAEKTVSAKIKAEEKWAKQRQTIQENSAKLAFRLAEQEVRDAEQAEEKKMRARERFARGMGRTIGGSITSLAGTAARVGGSLLALGGGFGVADAVQKQFGLEHEAALFSNQSSSSATGRISTKQVVDASRRIALENNVDATDVAKGMTAYYAKASDAPGALAQADLFAKLSKATGSSIEELATTAGSLRVQNPNLNDKEMRAMMLGIVGQTRHGAVDVADLVSHVPVITATAGAYAGDQTENQKRLIGLSQIAMRTSGDSAEAATATKHLALDVGTHKKAMQAMGIQTTDKEGKLLDPAELIGNIMEKTKGDIGKLHAAGIGDRSIALFLAEQNAYKAGGRKGVVDDVKSFTEGGYTEAGLKSDVDNVAAQSGEKFHRAVARVSEIIQEQLAPYLEKLADKLPELMPEIEATISGFKTIADTFIEHPIAGIGAIIAAQVGKDVAAAQIGNVISAAIARALGVSTASGAAGGAGAAGSASSGGGVSAIGVVAVAAAQGNSIRNMYADSGAGGRIADKLKSGEMTPEQAQKMIDDAKAVNAGTGAGDILPGGARMLGVDALGGDDFSARGKKLQESRAIANDSSLQKLITEMQRNTAALQASGGKTSPADPSRNHPITGGASK